jgi:hypothetical protein
MRHAVRKHRTPVVKTIKVNIGSHSMLFKLETERLVKRKAAIAIMAQLHDEAKSLTTRNQPASTASIADAFLDCDIELRASIDWARISDPSDFPLGSDRRFPAMDPFDFLQTDDHMPMEEFAVLYSVHDADGSACPLNSADQSAQNGARFGGDSNFGVLTSGIGE